MYISIYIYIYKYCVTLYLNLKICHCMFSHIILLYYFLYNLCKDAPIYFSMTEIMRLFNQEWNKKLR